MLKGVKMVDKLGRFNDKDYSELLEENARLKEQIKLLYCPFYFKHTAFCLGRKDEMFRHEKCNFYANCNVKKMVNDIKQYKQALAEIKEIINNACSDSCPDIKNGYCIGLGECAERINKQILQKIAEVME